MPIPNYSVLKGDPISGKVADGSSYHYQISVQTAADTIITVDVNVQSVDKSEVLYFINQAFTPPDPAGLLALPVGLTALTSAPGGLALDYVRTQIGGQPMIEQNQMTLLPDTVAKGSPKNDLTNAVIALLNAAIADKDGTIYAFGSAYSDPGDVNGIHDIHMNQGNPADNHESDNGVWQDGAVFINLPTTNTWAAIFIAFQTESWQTDDTTGDAV
jgi:uncharacterized protein YukJ